MKKILFEPEDDLGPTNPLLPAYSDAVTLKYDPVRGRHGVATRDVPAGTVLLLESPVAARLRPPFLASHCSHCLKRLGLAPLPCNSCTAVRYCSKECRLEKEQDSQPMISSSLDLKLLSATTRRSVVYQTRSLSS